LIGSSRSPSTCYHFEELEETRAADSLALSANFESYMRKTHFTLWTLVTLSFLSSSSLATTIVGFRTQTEAIIGADSKTTALLGPRLDPRCKIHVTNKVAWGLAGISLSGSYSPKDDIESYLLSSGTLAERIEKFESSMKKMLTTVAQAWKVANPKLFAEKFDGMVTMEILLAAEDRGVLRMFYRRFGTLKGTGGIVTVRGEDFPSQRHSDSVHVVLGTRLAHSAINKEIDSRPGLFDELGPEQSVKHLIESAINADPINVGPPISIIRVDKQGIKWIDHGVCQG
jgi:hypothetical protein